MGQSSSPWQKNKHQLHVPKRLETRKSINVKDEEAPIFRVARDAVRRAGEEHNADIRGLGGL